MPSAYADHGSMADIARDKALQHGAAVAGATRTEAASPKSDEISAHRAKTRSWDYIWRSGVAGGVAGCAVSYCSQTPNGLYGLCKKSTVSQYIQDLVR